MKEFKVFQMEIDGYLSECIAYDDVLEFYLSTKQVGGKMYCFGIPKTQLVGENIREEMKRYMLVAVSDYHTMYDAELENESLPF